MSAFPPRDPSTPDSIPRRNLAAREADPVDFRALRALGIAQTQAASGKRWTDYNLHDPGVTILEQLSFALTELTYRIDFPVVDQLTGPNGEIDYEGQALFPPQEILPCRPTTANDYRRRLLDQVPDLRDARFMPADGLRGLHRLRLRVAHHARAVRAVNARCRRDVRESYRRCRALGEDLDEGLPVIRTRFCQLSLAGEVESMRDPAEILADIYRCCDDAIAGIAKARGFEDLLRDDWSLDQIFDGPASQAGRIDEAEFKAMDKGRLALSQLRARLLGVPGVPGLPGILGLATVTRLELVFEADAADPVNPVASGMLKWNPDEWAPCLRTPSEGETPPNLDLIHLTRRGVEVDFDAGSVARRYADDTRPSASDRPESRAFETVVPPLKGQYREPARYESVQNQFPAIYGLGPRGPIDPTPQARAHVDQLRGYLALFDQVLANGAAQLDHVRDLFTPDRQRWHSYWRRVLGDDDITGIEDIYLDPAPEPRPAAQSPLEEEAARRRRAKRIDKHIHAHAHAPFDDAVDRRHRALDYLLALYGESITQKTSRQFLSFLSSRELDPVLLTNKVTYLKRSVSLGRDRAGGFDYREELWGARQNTPALHARICLLLAFQAWNARPLTQRMAPWRPIGRLDLSDLSGTDAEPPPHMASGMGPRSRPLAWPQRRRSKDGKAPPPRPRPKHVQRRLTRLRADPVFHGDLFVHGVWRRRYRWEPYATGRGGRLLLGADGEAWWRLGRFANEARASEFADALRRGLLAANSVSEGLHIVEHILLRPRGGDRRPLDPSFHALRATFVFPNWSARTVRRDFQKFAEETVRINCPAHVKPTCLWLDFQSMVTFETYYRAWLDQLREHRPPHRNPGLEDAAKRLEDCLRDHLDAQGRTG